MAISTQPLSPLNQPYLLPQQQQTQRYFCYLYISQQDQFYLCMAFCIIFFILLYKSVKQYLLTKKIGKVNIYIKCTYFFLIISLALYVTKVALASAIFWNQEQKKNDVDLYNKYSLFTKFIYFIDVTSLFCLQTAILFVPTNWNNNMIEFTTKSNIPLRNQTTSTFIQRSTKKERFCKLALDFYFILRLLVQIGQSISFFIFNNDQQNIDRLQVNLYTIQVVYLIQFIIVVIVLILTLLAINRNQLIARFIPHKQIKKMKKYYIYLILMAMLRLATNIFFSQFQLKGLNYQQQKIIVENSCYINIQKDVKVHNHNIVYLISQGLFTNVISAYAILKIYLIQERQISRYIRGSQFVNEGDMGEDRDEAEDGNRRNLIDCDDVMV